MSGPWRSLFDLNGGSLLGPKQKGFHCTYEMDVEDVPDGIAVIPLIANLMPVAWLCNATVVLDEIDQDCLESLERVRLAYAAMYPEARFRAAIIARRIRRFGISRAKGPPLILYSGGVDANFSLLSFRSARPQLVAVRGADIFFEEDSGWETVSEHGRATARRFGLDYTRIETSFRFFLNENAISKFVEERGIAAASSWWHDFQHGIGLLGVVAPLAWQNGNQTVVMSSSYSTKDPTPTPCAADSAIVSAFRFFDCQCIDWEQTVSRQEKVAFLCEQADLSGQKIPVRVCWRTRTGKNCCVCNKCMLTIFEIYAEYSDPADFGFELGDATLRKIEQAIEAGTILPSANWDRAVAKLRSGSWDLHAIKLLLAHYPDAQRTAARATERNFGTNGRNFREECDQNLR